MLWTALQVVSDCNTLLTPFLPASAQKVHETLGREGTWAAMPEIREVADDMPVEPVGIGVPEAGRTYVIMGDYADQQATWGRVDMVPGTALSKPKPLLPSSIRAGGTGPWAPVSRVLAQLLAVGLSSDFFRACPGLLQAHRLGVEPCS